VKIGTHPVGIVLVVVVKIARRVYVKAVSIVVVKVVRRARPLRAKQRAKRTRVSLMV